MFSFIVGILCGLGALVAFMFRRMLLVAWLRVLVIGALAITCPVLIIFSTSLWVGPDKGGLITKKFGVSLADGHLISVNGERGVQADVLSPGWSFWWWPFLYDLEAVDNKNITEGEVGIVTALDGKPLPEGEVYAEAWPSPTEMIDARKFLTKAGSKGPQLTVLPPGQYRFNPKLFTIDVKPCLSVPIGQVAVIKANAGLTYTNVNTQLVNGVPLVPKGYRGIWNEALTPNKYYLHPNAFEPTFIQTTKRVYSYTGREMQEANAKADRPQQDNSIPVRSSDGFPFPIDVRVTVAVLAEDAPFVVARFGDPDSVPEKDGFEILETRAILPSIRALLRNAAQSEGALQFVQKRSEVEAETKAKFTEDMAKDKIEVEAVYLADIRLDSTDEGKKLLSTQTDKQIAMQQQETYKQQVLAENERANRVKAQTAADQQTNIQASLANIAVTENEAQAAVNRARGEAAAYDAKVKALGGVDNFTRLEIAKMAFEALKGTWKGDVPSMLFMNGGAGGSGSPSMLSDIMSGVFAQQLSKTQTPASDQKK